jgi:hypothetical protein
MNQCPEVEGNCDAVLMKSRIAAGVGPGLRRERAPRGRLYVGETDFYGFGHAAAPRRGLRFSAANASSISFTYQRMNTRVPSSISAE